MLLELFGIFSRLFSRPLPYIAGWHQAPVREGLETYALHLELFTLLRAEEAM
jgi:UDPglucose--hexose-1-phosphate uridylyltransferase